MPEENEIIDEPKKINNYEKYKKSQMKYKNKLTYCNICKKDIKQSALNYHNKSIKHCYQQLLLDVVNHNKN